jgi:hypothetical protein
MNMHQNGERAYMAMKIYVAMQDALLVLSHLDNRWQVDVKLDQLSVSSGDAVAVRELRGEGYRIAVDPHQPTRLYCGTFGQGLWRSDDAGNSWEPIGKGITYQDITAVAVSQADRVGDYGVVWVGTEPSALFFSEDGGNTWIERPALQDLPSKSSWWFPPRPYTHHVRSILPDICEPNRIYVAIEVGGVMRSLDKGLTWEDRKPGSQEDGHTLRMHKLAPHTIYEASGGEEPVFHKGGPLGEYVTLNGGGFAESHDGGATWTTWTKGLEQHHYMWSLAIDPANPDTIVASAAPGPDHAHGMAMAESYLYRRTTGTPWTLISQGLPEPKGTLISEITSNEAEPGVFYAANNRGIFRSADTGLTWQQLDLVWPERYYQQQVQSIAVVGKF